MLACYLTGGEGLEAPEEVREVPDGHLQAAAAGSERQHLGLLQETTPPGALGQDHRLEEGGRRDEEEEKGAEQLEMVLVEVPRVSVHLGALASTTEG